MNIVDNSKIKTSESIKAYNSIIVYGVGSHFDELFDWTRKNNIEIGAVCDSDSKKWGSSTRGNVIISPDDALKRYENNKTAVVIGVVSFQKDIADYLNNKNVDKNDIFSFQSEFADENMYDYQGIYDSIELIKAAYDTLADAESRKLFENIINSKITRNPKYLVPTSCIVGPYNYSNANEEVKPIGCCVDAGAFTGDTAKLFMDTYNINKVICIEPLSENYNAIKKKYCNKQCVEVLQYALSDERGETFISSDSDISVRASIVNQDIGQIKEKVLVETIDRIFSQRPKIDFIKFDIEGAEMDALQGSLKTFERDKPSMVISAYHRTEHMWQIPLFIKEHFPESRILLGHQINAPFEPEYYVVL